MRWLITTMDLSSMFMLLMSLSSALDVTPILTHPSIGAAVTPEQCMLGFASARKSIEKQQAQIEEQQALLDAADTVDQQHKITIADLQAQIARAAAGADAESTTTQITAVTKDQRMIDVAAARDSIEEQQAQIEEQQAQIDEQQAQIEEQQAQIGKQQALLDAADTVDQQHKITIADLQAQIARAAAGADAESTTTQITAVTQDQCLLHLLCAVDFHLESP